MTTEKNGRGLLEKQGEFSGEKELLLCGVPEVTEWKECSDSFRKNDCKEVIGGTGTIIRRFILGRQEANVSLECNERDSFAVGCTRLFDRGVEE